MDKVRALSEHQRLRSTHKTREAQGTRRAGDRIAFFTYFLGDQVSEREPRKPVQAEFSSISGQRD